MSITIDHDIVPLIVERSSCVQLMLYLTELSIPLSLVRRTALVVDPIVAADQGYALKTWLSRHEGIAMRPWDAFPTEESVRLVGWRHQAPQPSVLSAEIYASHRQFTCRDGEEISLVGKVVPLRRTSRNGTIKRSRDAAEGYEAPNAAYEAWLRERLIDVMPYFDLRAFSITSTVKRRVLRKFGVRSRQVVREQVIPVVTVEISGTIKNGAHLEEWLAKGVGPQKAFGFGAFLPC